MTLFTLLKTAFRQWQADKAPRQAAALAYYTVFALAPLLLIVVAMASAFLGRDAVTGQLSARLEATLGGAGAQVLQELIAGARLRGGGTLAVIIGAATALLGASGLFGNLRATLNSIWDAAPPAGQGLLRLARNRLLSFLMVLLTGALLMLSLVASSLLAGLNRLVDNLLPGTDLLFSGLGFVVSVAIITILFAAIFKVLPDAVIAWRDVWTGAAVTALLFTAGQYLLGWYLGRSGAGSAYGAAGSLVALLLWIYYSAQIFLLGAEFTQVYARQRGSQRPPEVVVPPPAPRPVAPVQRPRDPQLAGLDLRPALVAVVSFVLGLLAARR